MQTRIDATRTILSGAQALRATIDESTADQELLDELDAELQKAEDALDDAQEKLDDGDIDGALEKLRESLKHLERAIELIEQLLE